MLVAIFRLYVVFTTSEPLTDVQANNRALAVCSRMLYDTLAPTATDREQFPEVDAADDILCFYAPAAR